MKAALLRGREHPAVGAVAEAAGGPLAAALSRGGAEKAYAYTDPNEDGALWAQGAHGLLVAAADGHWGERASELVLERLLATHAEDWTEGRDRGPDAWYQTLLAALLDLNAAVCGAHSPDQRSRSTLALALARPGQNLLVTASVGDSHVFRVAGGTVEEIGGPRPRRALFLGEDAEIRASAFERATRIGVEALEPCTALVVATDGLSEEAIGVADPPAAVQAAVADARVRAPRAPAAAAARALVEAALAAHRAHAAGDNVAAAVAWLEAAPGGRLSSLL